MVDDVCDGYFTLMTSGGVGYQVFATINTLAMLQPDRPVTMFIETQVREDHIHLFGFSTMAEKTWFNLLCTVQGVGAKVSLSILSTLTANQLYDAVSFGDKDLVATANGVGPKMAVRIVSELKDKVGKLSAVFKSGNGETAEMVDMDYKDTGVDADTMRIFGDMKAEAVTALVNLGYKKVDAMDAVTQAAKNMVACGVADGLKSSGAVGAKPDLKKLSVSDLIRESLKCFKV